MSPKPTLLEPKDVVCTVRVIPFDGAALDVLGFVRVLDTRGTYDDFALFVLCDDSPIVWRLRFEVAVVGRNAVDLTGLVYVGKWHDYSVVFMHPPTRADGEAWKPGQADMTLVKP